MGFKSYNLLFGILSTNLKDFDESVHFVMDQLHQQRSEILSWPLPVLDNTVSRQIDKIKKENEVIRRAAQR